jgi:hypothetical protein
MDPGSTTEYLVDKEIAQDSPRHSIQTCRIPRIDRFWQLK